MSIAFAVCVLLGFMCAACGCGFDCNCWLVLLLLLMLLLCMSAVACCLRWLCVLLSVADACV